MSVKILSAFVHGFLNMYSAILFVLTVLVLFISLENIEIYTRKKFGNPNKTMFLSFSGSFKGFRHFQIIATIGNRLYSEFVTVLVAVGVLAASVSTYVTLTLWGSFRFVIYINHFVVL